SPSRRWPDFCPPAGRRAWTRWWRCGMSEERRGEEFVVPPSGGRAEPPRFPPEGGTTNKSPDTRRRSTARLVGHSRSFFEAASLANSIHRRVRAAAVARGLAAAVGGGIEIPR